MTSQTLTSIRKGFGTLNRSHRGEFNFWDTLIFLGPIVLFVLILYGTLVWTVFVSFTDWKTIAANYTLNGFKWYNFPSPAPCVGT